MTASEVSSTGLMPLQHWQFELAAFVPWQQSGFDLPAVYSSALGDDGEPYMVGRQTPGFGLGADGALFFWEGSRLLQAYQASTQARPLGEVAGWLAFAPAGPDLVVFGSDKAGQAVLTRVAADGRVRWQHTNLPQTLRNFRRAKLMDGGQALYLYGADRPAGHGGHGQICRIDPTDGTIEPVAEFSEKPPEAIWARDGRLFWVTYLDGTRYWFRHNPESGAQERVAAEHSLQTALGQPCGALPGGGALLCGLSGELIWMDAGGGRSGHVRLAGLVRLDDGLVVAWREAETLRFAAWHDGSVSRAVSIALPGPARLVYATRETYYVSVGGGEIKSVDMDGTIEALPGEAAGPFRLAHETTLAVAKTLVDHQGALWLPGADAEGFFAARAFTR